MDHHRIAALTVGALIMCVPVVARAQARTDLLVAGAHVRFHTRMYHPSTWNGGRIDSVSTDSVFIVSSTWGRKPLGFARSDFTRLDVSTERTSRPADAVEGLVLGALAAGLTGYFVGKASGTTHNCWSICTPTEKGEFHGLVGAVGGGAVGLVVGVLRAPPEHWTTAIPPVTEPKQSAPTS